MAGFLKDLSSPTTHLRTPAEQWRCIRHTNLLERTFGKSRRRLKVISRQPGEEPASRWTGPRSPARAPAGAVCANIPQGHLPYDMVAMHARILGRSVRILGTNAARCPTGNDLTREGARR